MLYIIRDAGTPEYTSLLEVATLRVTANARNTLYNKRRWYSRIHEFVRSSWLILQGNTNT